MIVKLIEVQFELNDVKTT